mmetsp:Transcript_11045/g.27518  ORF Transcript_11045/g.27518 Transcript_11045/m.27518 type:complete len:1272 (+) Transcript_11045:92-3907(+)
MADEPFLALKVGPYSCVCLYGETGQVGDHELGLEQEEEDISASENDALVSGSVRITNGSRSPHRGSRLSSLGPAMRDIRANQEDRAVSRESTSLAVSPLINQLAAERNVSSATLGQHNWRFISDSGGPSSPSSSSVGMFARRALNALHFVEEEQENRSPTPTPPRIASIETQQDILPRRMLARSSSLSWVGKVFRKVWPKVDEAIFKMVKAKVEPKIQELSPALRGLYFKAFTLGRQHPKVTAVEVWQSPCQRSDEEEGKRGLELHLDLVLDAAAGKENVHIELADSFTRMTAGVSSLTVKGKLVIRLEPLLDHSPIIGGIVAYFVDPPKVEARFEGLAKIADFALLQGSVRSIINREIADLFVLPNVFHKALVRDEEVVDTSVLKDPKPAGVLRVTAISARNLTGVDWRLFSKATSDPYLRLLLSADEWKTLPVYKTCDPDWPDGQYKDFLVYDREQKLHIDVHDWGPMKSHDRLGQAKPLRVLDVMELSEKPITLYDPHVDLETAKGDVAECGTVKLRFQWLEIEPEPDTQTANGAVVRVKLDELYLPASLHEERAAICARVGTIEQSTKCVKGNPMKAGEGGEDGECVFEVEHVLNLALPPGATPDDTVLELSVVNAKKKVLGTYCVNLDDVAGMPGMTKSWPRYGRMRFSFSNRPSQTASIAIAAEVTVTWLGLTLVPHDQVKTEFERLVTREPPRVKELTPGVLRHGSQMSMTSMMSCATGADINLAEKLDWLNHMFEYIWPKMMNLIRTTLENPDGRVNQKLQAKMPRFLKRLRFSRFVLGRKSPEFELRQVREAPRRLGQEGMEGVELHLDFKLDSRGSSDSHIEIFTGIFGKKIGVASFMISGELVVRLEPLLEEMPVVGGVVICCLTRPRVDMQFSGMAAQLVDKGLEGSLRSLIDWGISSCLVMPNVLGFAIGRESQGVDRALLRQPKLLGVLRITVLQGKVWHEHETWYRKLFRLACCGRCASRMLLRLTVADEPYSFEDVLRVDESAIGVDDEEDSVEHQPSHDFLVYDERQHLEIDIIDKCGLETVLASAEPLDIEDAAKMSEKVISLDPPAEDDSGNRAHLRRARRRAGEVKLQCQLLLAKFSTRGRDEWSMIRVKVDELYMPAALLVPDQVEDQHLLLGLGASVIARVGNTEKATPWAKYYPRNEKVDTPLMGPTKTIAELKRSSGEQLELEVEFVLYLPVRREDLENEVLYVDLKSKTKGHVGSVSVPLAEALKRPDLKLVHDENNKLKIPNPDGFDSELMIIVSIMGLEPARTR